MTAFSEVMTAEKEADATVVAAREEVAAAIEVAESDRRTRIVATESELKEAEQAELTKHERRIADMVQKIADDAEAQVIAIKQRFTSRKAELTNLLKERFNK